MAAPGKPLQAGSVYEGPDPYVFVSYSHKDIHQMKTVEKALAAAGVRYWYDDGLHSGDDWNMIIATHLKNAAVCLLLLSRNSAKSPYVKNELNFAQNHRIQVYTLRLEAFPLPPDIEMMVGRHQMTDMEPGYESRLIEAFPAELFADHPDKAHFSAQEAYEHPMFRTGGEIAGIQGTAFYAGTHKRLGYDILILRETLPYAVLDDVRRQTGWIGKLSHPLFPVLYDVVIDDAVVWTYQEYRNEVLLDTYLKEHRLPGEEIIRMMKTVVSGMEYLFSRQLCLRDFARGSILIGEGGEIRICRLQNPYYGVVRLQPETRQYYFEQTLTEIAVLAYKLCMAKDPILPIGIIQDDRLGRSFLNRMNLMIQKCAREHGRARYGSFRQILEDLDRKEIPLKEILFLQKQQKKLALYEKEKRNTLERFTSGETVQYSGESPERKFGFDETVYFSDETEEESWKTAGDAKIRIVICSTGQRQEFSKPAIIVGRDRSVCDVTLEQRAMSRRHARISLTPDGRYEVEDLNSSGGTILPSGETISGRKGYVSRNEIIEVGGVKLQLL